MDFRPFYWIADILTRESHQRNAFDSARLTPTSPHSFAKVESVRSSQRFMMCLIRIAPAWASHVDCRTEHCRVHWKVSLSVVVPKMHFQSFCCYLWGSNSYFIELFVALALLMPHQLHLFDQIILQTCPKHQTLEHFDRIGNFVHPFNEIDSMFHHHIGSFVHHSCSDFLAYFLEMRGDGWSQFIAWFAALFIELS